jgi:uncharacterized protein (DUF4415 family)
MAKTPDPFMIDDENPAWTARETAAAKPFGEVFPAQLATWKKRGRPPAETPKVHIGFRLSADVVRGLRTTGRGYNARVEKVLREGSRQGPSVGPRSCLGVVLDRFIAVPGPSKSR